MSSLLPYLKTRQMSVAYRQSSVFSTGQGGSTNNTLSAVDHYSRKQRLRKFKDAPNYNTSDGRSDSGEWEDVDFYCVVQPLRDKPEHKTISGMQGETIHGALKVHYNPLNHRNRAINSKGVYARLSDSRDDITGDYNGFSDLLFYDNEWWKLVSHNKYHVMDETHDDAYKGVLCRCEFSLFRGVNHEIIPKIDTPHPDASGDSFLGDDRMLYELGSADDYDEF